MARTVLLGLVLSSPPASGARAHLDLSGLRHLPVRRTILAYTGHAWELYISRGWLAAFLTTVLAAHGLPPTAAASKGSQWAALMAGLGTPAVWIGGWVSDALGRARASLAIALASGLCSLGFGFLGAAPWGLLLVTGCVYGIIVSADSAIYSTAVTELAPPDRIGSAQAARAFLGFGASAAAPLAAGWLLDLGVGWGGVFVLAGAVGIGLALTLLPLAGAAR
ncbi:MAG TPA: MFS transporter [bacterium]|nr:MFS transporter [bacterium]